MLRAALFPPQNGKHPRRPSKYPVVDGINYEGIDFPAPVKQIDKLESQNSKLAINVFGWENNCVIVHRISRKKSSCDVQAMSQLQKEMKCIANNMEKYITFPVGGLHFIDSFNFLQGSLDSLVSATPKESLKMTAAIAKGSDLLFKKGIYPYEDMDTWERFGETSLPDKEKFYSKLYNEHITDEEYEHAQSVWEAFRCKMLGDYITTICM